MKNKMKIMWTSLLLVISGISTFSVLAANSVTVNFKGNLVLNPPCDVTGEGGGPISVDFSDMVIRRIEGTAYKQLVPYQLTCDAPGETVVALTFKGEGAEFDQSALVSSNKNLGFKLLLGASPIRLNIDLMKFQNNNHSSIYAYPVINSGVAITAINTGPFTASAILEASYP